MNGQGAMRTRSGHVIHHNLRPMPEPRSRVTSSPKPKKTKKEKVKAEKKVAKLEKPLSELTKDWKHVPVVDIEAYVNRSAEERRREVEEGKVPGKVKRPMNSFMLYRKAYQNRTKDWCLQNNHQIVSQVCGDSWPLEPEEVKEQFNEWARIERQNHQNAHPGYKFSPSKPGTSKAAKRKVSEEPMTEDSDLDDFDWGGPQSRRSKKQRPVPRPDAPVAYPTTRSAYNYSSRDNSVEPSNDGFHKSSWQYSNPGRSVPAQYNQAGLGQGQYYQQSTQNNHNMPGAKVEDVIIRKATVPGVHSFVPGGHQFDMMNPYSQFDLSQEQHRHDPSLGHGDYTYGEHHPDGVFFGESHSGDHHWHGSHNMIDRHRYDPTLNYIDPELDNMQIHDQHAGALRGNQDGWHVESLHEGQEFDKWMDEE
jgi:hypothetical protein